MFWKESLFALSRVRRAFDTSNIKRLLESKVFLNSGIFIEGVADSHNKFYSFYGGLAKANLQNKHLIKGDNKGQFSKMEINEIQTHFPNARHRSLEIF